MLARHAQDLYWAGRYLERAESTVRALEAALHEALDGRACDPTDPARALADALFVGRDFLARHERFELAALTEYVALDGAFPGAIAASIARARENVRGVRQLVSTEFFEALNSLYLELSARGLRLELRREPTEVLARARSGCQLVAAAASETLARDDGYRGFAVGRLLERAEMTCRLLGALEARGEGADGFALLRSLSAAEACARLRGLEFGIEDVLELLLLAPELPRSVRACLRGAQAELLAFEHPARFEDAARRLAALLAIFPLALGAAGSPRLLERVSTGIHRVAEALEEHFQVASAALELRSFGTA
jgi:uncharacterized alpha-E superfamily protein